MLQYNWVPKTFSLDHDFEIILHIPGSVVFCEKYRTIFNKFCTLIFLRAILFEQYTNVK